MANRFQTITRQVVRAKIKDISYVALSYVWGKSAASDDVGNGSQLSARVPHTIDDAIKVTTQLGFQYIWIDKYCINKFEPQDVQDQVMMMDVFYHAASVTIVAATGADSMFGLPGMSVPILIRSAIRIDDTTWVATRPRPKHFIIDSPWFSRGWT